MTKDHITGIDRFIHTRDKAFTLHFRKISLSPSLCPFLSRVCHLKSFITLQQAIICFDTLLLMQHTEISVYLHTKYREILPDRRIFSVFQCMFQHTHRYHLIADHKNLSKMISNKYQYRYLAYNILFHIE